MVKSGKTKARILVMQDTKTLKDQHPAVGPGLAGALGPLLKGRERTGVSNDALDAIQ
jgi:hypothetical protein